MILGYSNLYPLDNCERVLPDAYSARRLIERQRPDIPGRLDAILSHFRMSPEEQHRHLSAALLGVGRLGMRHGGFGSDPHAYHNEDHVFELAERRLGRVLDTVGVDAMPIRDWATLVLFAACHDLRQRETFDVPGPIGGNEAASIAETFRILDACGFERGPDRDTYVALELMIAGSTFDARPAPRSEGEDVALAAGGSLARGLGLWLDNERPGWTTDAAAVRGERLGRLAADLDTGNVGEEFEWLSESALRLCREREMRSGRRLDKPASGPSCLGFLTRGQLTYFFELHRFGSREGQLALGPCKERNAAAVKAVSAALDERFADIPPPNGQAVMDAFRELSLTEAERLRATAPPAGAGCGTKRAGA